MSLDNWIDARKILQRLNHSILEGTLSHGFLVEIGSSEVGVKFGKDMAKALWCKIKPGIGCDSCPTCRKIDSDSHGDLLVIESQGSVGVEDVFKIQDALRKKTVEESGHFVIVEHGELMTESAQNKLLKTLEEPEGDTHIVIVTDSRTSLMATIRSRCQIIPLGNFVRGGLDQEDVEIARRILNYVFMGESFFVISNYVNGLKLDKDSALRILNAMEDMFATKLRVENGKVDYVIAAMAIPILEEGRKRLLLNVRASHVIKKIILEMEDLNDRSRRS